MSWGDRTRQPDENIILGDANPRDQIDLLAAKAHMEDFAPTLKGGAAVGNNYVVLRPDEQFDQNRVAPGEGDFEGNDVSMWSVAGAHGTLAITTANVYNGSYAMLYTSTDTTQPQIRYRDGTAGSIAVTEGEGIVAVCKVLPLDEYQQVYFNFTFTDDNGSFPFGSFGTPSVGAWPDTVGTWYSMYASAVVPPGMTRCWVDIIISKPSASGKRWVFDDFGVFPGNSYVGPMSTSPAPDGERIELMGNTEWLHTGHPTELIPGYIKAGIRRGATENDDRLSVYIQGPGTPVGDSAATLAIESGAESGLDTSYIRIVQGMLYQDDSRGARLRKIVSQIGGQAGLANLTPANNSNFQEIGRFTLIASPDTGVPLYVMAVAVTNMATLSATAVQGVVRCDVSFNNGSTWVTGLGSATDASQGNHHNAGFCSVQGTPSAAVLVRMMGAILSGTQSNYVFQNNSICALAVVSG